MSDEQTKNRPEMDDPSFILFRNTDREIEIREFISVCSGTLALPLFMAFWIADLIYVPEHSWEFLIVRSLMIPICLLTNYHIKHNAKTLRAVQQTGLAFVLANALSITYMIYRMGTISSAYYAGLNLVGFGVITFVPWTQGYLILSAAATYFPFFAMAPFLNHSKEEIRIFLTNSFFIASTAIISLVVRHFTETLRLKELHGRQQLQHELAHRAEIIREKTSESIRLTTLTKQFSPQVVHQIQTGQLNILDSIHRSEICAIFIDIVNSTDHVRHVNMEQVNEVISMFMEDTMKVLLKYDITIDKFLGDGVLGFSNDPIARHNFIERVADAALEIRRRILARQKEYAQRWETPLQVRIGIATGEASVGFYGSESYVRTYTAIGKVMNLASRLCAMAGPNQIVISEAVQLHLPNKGYPVNSLGVPSLKGFQNETFVVFELLDRESGHYETTDIATCPSGHGILHLDTNDSGIYVFICRTCGFEHDETKPQLIEKEAA